MGRYQLRDVGVLDTDSGVVIGPDSGQAWADYLAAMQMQSPGPAPISPPMVPELVRAEKIASVGPLRDEQLALGVAFGGHLFQSDPQSQSNLTGIIAACSAGVPLPNGFTWRSADNIDVPMALPDLIGLAASMLARGDAIWKFSWALKTQLAAAKDPSTIDITQGWPP